MLVRMGIGQLHIMIEHPERVWAPNGVALAAKVLKNGSFRRLLMFVTSERGGDITHEAYRPIAGAMQHEVRPATLSSDQLRELHQFRNSLKFSAAALKEGTSLLSDHDSSRMKGKPIELEVLKWSSIEFYDSGVLLDGSLKYPGIPLSPITMSRFKPFPEST